MATINLNYKHGLLLDDAKGRIELFIHEIQQQLGLSWNWESDNVVSFSSKTGLTKGITGKLTLNAHDVDVEIDLPMMLKPMKSMVEKQIKDKLVEKLSQ
jgi:putative polyhydroxyalkanoate system protein